MEKLDIYQKTAQFLINVKTKKPREIICQALILGVLEGSQAELNFDQLAKAIKEKWALNVPEERIRKGIDKLVSGNSVKKRERSYSMSEKQKEQYRQSIQNRVSFFEEVEQDWLEAMQRTSRCRKLTEPEKKEVTDDFRIIIDKMCDGHVEKIINFLKGEANELDDIFIGSDINDCIAESSTITGEISEIEQKIFPLFFMAADERRARYCAGIAQTYLRRTIFEVETQGQNLFGSKMKSINIYFDTNIIFRLFGLHGFDKKEITESIININRSLGIHNLVDIRSIKEFRAVLNKSRRDNIGPRIPKGIFDEIKKAIIEPRYRPKIKFVLPNDPFALMFWASLESKFAKNATRREIVSRWDNFLNFMDSVDIILSEKYKVKIVDYSKNIDTGNASFKHLKDLVLQAADRGNFHKTQGTAEHDVMMYLMIMEARENEVPALLPSNSWILTADKTLKEFHKLLVRENEAAISYFLPAGAWMELTLPFLTIQLIDENDSAIAVAKSFGEGFEYYAVDRIQATAIAEVLQRVPEASEKGSELVLRCAANRLFRETVVGVLAGTKVPRKEEIDEAVIKAFENIEDKSVLANEENIKELKAMRKQTKEFEEQLKVEKEGRGKAEAFVERWEKILRVSKLMAILIAISSVSGYIGYFLIKPSINNFSLGTVVWICGCVYLSFWIYACISAKSLTPRALLLTFLMAPAIFIIGIFERYWDNLGIVSIISTVLVGLISLVLYLIRKSWLDVRIMLRK